MRRTLAEDEPRIAELLELNGMPRGSEILAALRYSTEPKRLLLELLVADPWAGEGALYTGARPDYLREAGYRRIAGAWRADATRPLGRRAEPPRGWRRAFRS